MQQYRAIEITSIHDWEIICALQPNCKELDAEANIGNFVVVEPDSGKLEGAILSPGAVAEHMDHIEPHSQRLKIVTIIGNPKGL